MYCIVLHCNAVEWSVLYWNVHWPLHIQMKVDKYNNWNKRSVQFKSKASQYIEAWKTKGDPDVSLHKPIEICCVSFLLYGGAGVNDRKQNSIVILENDKNRIFHRFSKKSAEKNNIFSHPFFQKQQENINLFFLLFSKKKFFLSFTPAPS